MCYVCPSLIASRFFSAAAAAVEKAVPTKVAAPKSGGGRRNTINRRFIGLCIRNAAQYIQYRNGKKKGVRSVSTSSIESFESFASSSAISTPLSTLGSPFWEHVKEILNPATSVGAEPRVYYSIYAFFVFLFNIFDIANLPKELAEYLNKMGARISNIKPGKATVEYLSKIQASTRFWGGLLLSILATTSSILDHYLRHINEGFAVGFTSILIIVGSIIELRRSYQACNVMPS